MELFDNVTCHIVSYLCNACFLLTLRKPSECDQELYLKDGAQPKKSWQQQFGTGLTVFQVADRVQVLFHSQNRYFRPVAHYLEWKCIFSLFLLYLSLELHLWQSDETDNTHSFIEIYCCGILEVISSFSFWVRSHFFYFKSRHLLPKVLFHLRCCTVIACEKENSTKLKYIAFCKHSIFVQMYTTFDEVSVAP